MTPIALAALSIAIVLMYWLGARALASARLGALTAVLFASTPLLWQSHPAASLTPLPFVVGWLVAIAHAGHPRAAWWPVLAGACLGAGMYTSNAAAVMMPLYLVLTIVVVYYSRVVDRSQLVSRREIGLLVAAFCVAAAPIAISNIRYPESFRDTVNAHHLYDANRFNLRQGVREMASWVGLTARTEVYYDYFNPAFLFLTGRVLLLPLALLIPFGLYHIVADETTPVARLLVAGFVAAPFAAALTANPPLPSRILFITPFAAILSAYGLKYLLSPRFSFFAGWSPSESQRHP